MLHKPKKIDSTVRKSFRVIGILNCQGKVCEKVATDISADWYEVHNVLHEGQMGLRRQRSAIDAVVRVTEHIQKAWGKEK